MPSKKGDVMQSKAFNWENVGPILARINAPYFPARELNVRDCGAAGDGVTLDTLAIQRAIQQIHERGGGRVILPAGRFLCGSLVLLSDVNLHLESEESVLLFTTQTDEQHYPLALSHWESTPLWNYRALIYALRARNIAITGKGTLDGQASEHVWWNWTHQIEHAWSQSKTDWQRAASVKLREMNLLGVPLAERRFGNGHFLRPNFIQTLYCENVLLEGVTLRNSPMWQVNPVMCRNVIVRGMTLRSHGHNNDGVDPESCCDVLIENNLFDSGDDCIALKSGRDRDGREAATPCENIIIRHNHFADGHGGIALGSEMSGGIRNVFAEHNHFDSPQLTYPLRLKANAQRGGIIENIWLRHSRVKQVRDAVLHATMHYAEGIYGEHVPCFKHIVVEDLIAEGGEYGLFLEALPQAPLEGLVLKDIRIDGVEQPLHAANWSDDAHIENVRINGLHYPRPVKLSLSGVPHAGGTLTARAVQPGSPTQQFRFTWWLAKTPDGTVVQVGTGTTLTITPQMISRYLRCEVQSGDATLVSKAWQVLPGTAIEHGSNHMRDELYSRGILHGHEGREPQRSLTRFELAQMVIRLWQLQYRTACEAAIADLPTDSVWYPGITHLLRKGIFSLIKGKFLPQMKISREEAATVAMMSCGVSYRNTSSMLTSTFTDGRLIRDVYLTNAQRAVAFGFLTLDDDGHFHPRRHLRWDDALAMLLAIARFIGDQDSPQQPLSKLNHHGTC